MSNRDVYASVFAEVVKEMEEGRAPWVRGWRFGLPMNALTKRTYSGGNVLALMVKTARAGWTLPYFVTFKQALAAGCVVRKGEKGTPVYFMSTLAKRSKEKSEGDEGSGSERFFFARQFTVFNVDQLDELEPGALVKLRPEMPVVTEDERDAKAYDTVRQTGADVRYSTADARAYFAPQSDYINMPDRALFDSSADFFGTLFHELTHWTGHASRLNRDQSGRFGNPEYAFEELVAEFGACFLSTLHGYETKTQSAAYLRGWAKACKENPEMLPRAASLAQKAVTLICPSSSGELDEAEQEMVAA